MRYLQTYKLFESAGNDLQDILLEINDEPFWQAKCWADSQLGKWVIIIQTVDEDDEYKLKGQTPPLTVIECIERTIDFMKSEGFINYQITFEMDKDDQIEEISLEEVSDLDVWPNNFIRIEFW